MIKSFLFVVLGALSLACCHFADCSTHAAPAPVKAEPKLPQFSIEQIESDRCSGIYFSDRKSGQRISIVSDSIDCFAAFYSRNSKSVLPDFAVGTKGIQLRTSEGKLHWITIEELAALDRQLEAVPK